MVRYLNVDPSLPIYVHLTSTRHHSHDRCSQAIPVICHSSTSLYYTDNYQRTKTGGGLGTRLKWPTVNTESALLLVVQNSLALFPEPCPAFYCLAKSWARALEQGCSKYCLQDGQQQPFFNVSGLLPTFSTSGIH